MKLVKPLKSFLKVITSQELVNKLDKNGDGKVSIKEVLNTSPKFWLFVVFEIAFNTFGWNDYIHFFKWVITKF